MDYQKLCDLNDYLKKISSPFQQGGKIYVEVAKRIQGFWQLYPNGRIITEWPELTDSVALCVAKVYDGEVLLTTGTARELKGAGFVNKTSYVENAETSAIGRALGILGIGSVDSIASQDEVKAATHGQKDEKPQNTVRSEFVKTCQRFGLNPGKEARDYGLNNDSTDEEFRAAIMMIESNNYGG